MYSTSLFIFRRDLRLEDNRGLIKALELSRSVIPCFIVTPEQIGPINDYRSFHALKFMAQSLIDLNNKLNQYNAHLYSLYGEPKEILNTLITTLNISAVFVNRDYTPYSTRRDAELSDVCKEAAIPFIVEHDALLHEPEEGLSRQEKPYHIFTPFFKKNSSLLVKEPTQNNFSNYYTKPIQGSLSTAKLISLLIPQELTTLVQGGRDESIRLLQNLHLFRDYAVTKDFPEQATTLLSAPLKFGTLSIREVYQAVQFGLSPHHPLIRQLFWRDFFYHIAFFYPTVFGNPFHQEYASLPWSNDTNAFKRWCEGTTGFPIVDAGMRQLATTGFMHNRARLITASFLIKDLHIDWRWGEQYFAQQLTDYDPCVNNGNWQWVASTGCDNQPYFRIFNPWLQQKKFDPECHYIKEWIPELRTVEPHTIHHWFKQTKSMHDYPPPMLDHAKEAATAQSLYKRFSRKE